MSPRPAAAPPVPAPAPAPRSMIYLGMDVHKDSITIAVLPQSAKTPTRLDKLANDLPKLQQWIERIARDGEIHACYEASGAGYVLHRALAEWGYACDVIAPSLIPKRSGVHRKHDKRVGGRPGAALSGRRARRGAHSERGRRAGARCRAVPGDLPARDPQIAARHPHVPCAARVRVSGGHQLVHAAPQMAAASHDRRLAAGHGGSPGLSRVPCAARVQAAAAGRIGSADCATGRVAHPRPNGETAAVLPRHLGPLGDGLGHGDRGLAPRRAAIAVGLLPRLGLARRFERHAAAAWLDYESGQQSLSSRAGPGRVELPASAANQCGSQATAGRPTANRQP